MNFLEKIGMISKYLSNENPYHRIPDVRQWEHFVRGVYIVRGIPNLKFKVKFLKFLDENEIDGVSLQDVETRDEIYTIVVD